VRAVAAGIFAPDCLEWIHGNGTLHLSRSLRAAPVHNNGKRRAEH
jgi:hypothetical protein